MRDLVGLVFGVEEVLGGAFIVVDLDACFGENIGKAFFLGRDVFGAVPVVGCFNCFLAGVDWLFLDFCELFFVVEVLFDAALAAPGKFSCFLPEMDGGFLDTF